MVLKSDAKVGEFLEIDKSVCFFEKAGEHLMYIWGISR